MSGIGPKLAVTILSGMQADDLVGALRQGDIARLTRIPGIGKKTAERMVLELRDKAGAAQTGTAGTGGSGPISLSPLAEARAALESLGYKPAEAAKLTDAVCVEGMSTDQLIREALKRAVRQ